MVRVINEQVAPGVYYKRTYEDPGSGIMWLPSVQTHAMHSCASVIPLRFAMADKLSTSWRLCPIFWRPGGYVSREASGAGNGDVKQDAYIILETAESASEIAFFEVLPALDLASE